MKKTFIGYQEAYRLTIGGIVPIDSETIDLADAYNRVAAKDLYAIVNSPSVDASLKDGYAIQSVNIQSATPESPVQLKVTGFAAAGSQKDRTLIPGTAVRVLTGAKIPRGADAVVAEEFTETKDNMITVFNNAEPGRNIFLKGSDVASGELIIKKGTRLSSGRIGILAAAGFGEIPVFKKPRVSIVATGNEIVAPGLPLVEGKLYASNLVTLNAWCKKYGFETTTDVVRDEAITIKDIFENIIDGSDAIITSGGAWTGDRDLVVRVLEDLGWEQIFHRIKIGPGKAVGFGLLMNKPVFVLPGGPPSNLIGFLQIALPGLLKLSGDNNPTLATIRAKLSESIKTSHKDWTQFIFGKFENCTEGPSIFHPLLLTSRLQSISNAQGVITVREGIDHLKEGTYVTAHILE